MSFRNITPREFLMMMRKKNFFLIRAPISSHDLIKGTDLIMDSFDIEEYEDKLPKDKEAEIIVYCMRGNSSRTVSQELIKADYRNVGNLEGGMVALHAIGGI